MNIKKILFLIVGFALIAIGYLKMGEAPPGASLEEMLTLVKEGQIAIFLGSACVLFAISRKS